MLHTLASVRSVSDLALGRVYAPSDRLHALDTSIPHVRLGSYVLVVLAPESLPLSGGMGFVAGLLAG